MGDNRPVEATVLRLRIALAALLLTTGSCATASQQRDAGYGTAGAGALVTLIAGSVALEACKDGCTSAVKEERDAMIGGGVMAGAGVALGIVGLIIALSASEEREFAPLPSPGSPPGPDEPVYEPRHLGPTGR